MPRYLSCSDYRHNASACTGVLLCNLGTPARPSPPAIRAYLAEFLSDTRVIELPRILWQGLLYGVILPFRPYRLRKAYQAIWTDEGSPLLAILKRQEACLQHWLRQHRDPPIRVACAMRYGAPSIQAGLERLMRANAHRILVFPLYPQYSATTVASTFDAVANVLKTWRWIPEIRMINRYYDHPKYITALVKSIQAYWQVHTPAEKLILSFHGLPQSYCLGGDPYYDECLETARLVTQRLQLSKDRWQCTFQSRIGRQQWLQPYTDITLKELASHGVKHVQVICPGFSGDCLETLEEIDIQNRMFFLANGGQQFSYIPALNDSVEHIDMLGSIVLAHCDNWG